MSDHTIIIIKNIITPINIKFYPSYHVKPIININKNTIGIDISLLTLKLFTIVFLMLLIVLYIKSELNPSTLKPGLSMF